MATIEVASWEDLVTAITSHSSGDVIKLTADIDCNNSIPLGVSSTVNCGNDVITIDGSYVENGVTKNRLILNLRTSVTTPVAIFSFGGTNHSVYIKNLDFANLILDAPLFSCYGSSTPSHIYLQSCRFVGRRSGWFMAVDDFVNHLTSCFFNVKYVGTNIDQVSMCQYESWADQTADFCVFKENVADKCMSTSPSGSKPCCSAHPFKLNGCRIDGTLSVVYPWAASIVERYSYNAPIQNVVDADMACRVDTSSDIQVYAPKGVWLKKAYLYSNPSTTGYNFQNKNTSGTIPVTESQLTDVAYLASQGFDIVT